jgi:hypothetical protein
MTGDATGPGPHEDVPPPRPRADDRTTLRFRTRKAVRWYDPTVLVGSAARAAITTAFGSFLDKRELQAQLPDDSHRALAGRDEAWVDYVADTGDGFAGTYTMAWLAAQESLAVDEPDGADGPGGRRDLPRGDVLVLGGDQCYPAATATNYEDRMEGPFRAALPWTDPPHPLMFALPGNHDWYDGLTGFLRIFAQKGWIGGWRTAQSRSYFAVELPHRWWLWGVDMLASAYLDQPQLDYFTKVASEQMRPGDRLVLAVPAPTWVELESDPTACRNLGYLRRTVIERHGIDLRLTVAGDLHHYARYRDTATGARHLVTAGGGGAFLHPTHTLPERVTLDGGPGTDGHHGEDYALAGEPYPDRRTSRRLALASLGLPVRNPAFMAVPGALYPALLATARYGLRSLAGGTPPSTARMADTAGWKDLVTGIVRNPGSGLGVGALGVALVAFSRPPPSARRKPSRWAWRLAQAATQTAGHVAAAAAVGTGAAAVARPLARGGEKRFVAGVTGAEAVLGGVAGSLVLGGYLALANGLPGLRAHANEAFSASRLGLHKNLLRMHVDRQGRLTVHALGVPRTVSGWRPDPDNPRPGAPWLAPPDGGPPQVHVVDRFTLA